MRGGLRPWSDDDEVGDFLDAGTIAGITAGGVIVLVSA
eukprot:gene15158-23966_t